MSPKHVLPAELTDRAMWRRIKAAVHPDRTGDHEQFLFVTAAEEHFVGLPAASPCSSCRRGGSSPGGDFDPDTKVPERVPYDSMLGEPMRFIDLTCRAIRLGREAGEPYKSVTDLLSNCPTADHGREEMRQRRGASYKQAGYIAHLAGGFSSDERREWYGICRGIPHSEAHARHILNKLKGGGRRAA